MQCASVHSGTRCKKLRGHAGWHYGGMWFQWLTTKERKDALADGQCEVTVRVVRVKTQYRRQGIATQMLQTARTISEQHGLVPPTFAQKVTDLGHKWGKTTGLTRK